MRLGARHFGIGWHIPSWVFTVPNERPQAEQFTALGFSFSQGEEESPWSIRKLFKNMHSVYHQKPMSNDTESGGPDYITHHSLTI